jgi:hypothetical protein
MAKNTKRSRKMSRKPTVPPQSASPTGEGDIPAHRKIVINMLEAYMAAAKLTAASLADKLGVLPANIYQYKRGDKPIPMSWVGVGEAKSGNNRERPRSVDLVKALNLTDAQAAEFVERVMVSHCPRELVDIIDRYRVAYNVANSK